LIFCILWTYSELTHVRPGISLFRRYTEKVREARKTSSNEIKQAKIMDFHAQYIDTIFQPVKQYVFIAARYETNYYD